MVSAKCLILLTIFYFGISGVLCEFECVETGRFLDPESDCEKYFYCFLLRGRLTYLSFQCDNGSLFSIEEARCVTASNLVCKFENLATEPPAITDPSDPLKDFICPKEGNFVNKIDKDCRSYVHCKKINSDSYKQEILYCDDGLLFAHDVLKCVGQELYVCPIEQDDPTATSEPTTNSTASDSTLSDSTSNTTLTTLESTPPTPSEQTSESTSESESTPPTPSSESTSETTSNITSNEPTPPTSDTSLTTVDQEEEQTIDYECISAGRYGHKSSDCKEFILCLENSDGTFSQYLETCPSSTLFSPEQSKCVLANDYICNQSQTTNNQTEGTTIGTSASPSESTSPTPSETTLDSNDTTSNSTLESTPPTPSESTSDTTLTTVDQGEPTLQPIIDYECTAAGRYAHNSSDCKEFILCLDNYDGTFSQYLETCPPSTLFSPKESKCVLANNYICNESQTTNNQTEDTTISTSESPSESTPPTPSETTLDSNDTTSNTTLTTLESIPPTPSEQTSESTSESTSNSTSHEPTPPTPSETTLDSNDTTSNTTLTTLESTPPTPSEQTSESTSESISNSTSHEPTPPTPSETTLDSNDTTSNTTLTTLESTPPTPNEQTSESTSESTSNSTSLEPTPPTSSETTLDSSDTTSNTTLEPTPPTPSEPTSDTTLTTADQEEPTWQPIIDYECTAAGRYAHNSSDCKQFILCLQNDDGTLSKYLETCPSTTLFSPEKSKCVLPGDYICSESTNNQTEDTTIGTSESTPPTASEIPIEPTSDSTPTPTEQTSDSTSDIISNTTLTTLPTPSESTSDSTPSQTPTTQQSNESEQFNCTAKGRFEDPNSIDCRTYIQCSLDGEGNFVSDIKTCPGITIFSRDGLGCVLPSTYTCPATTTTLSDGTTISTSEIPNTTESPPIDVSTLPPGCFAGNENYFICPDTGKYPNRESADCTTYILCLRTKSGDLVYANLDCEEGTLFSEKSKSCISAEKVACQSPARKFF